jgi:hypothetical protein
MKQVQKAFFYVSLIVVFLTLLSYYSNFIFLLGKGDQSFGSLARPAATFATFPSKVRQILVEEIGGVPPTYVKKDQSFSEMNNLKYDLFGLNAFWNNDLKRWDATLFNFKNDSIIYEWHIDKTGLDLAGHRQFPNSEVRNPILLENKSLIVAHDMTPNLIRIDSNSNIVWGNHEMIFHHSLNMDADSNIWACTTDRTGGTKAAKTGRPIKNLNGHTMQFLEDYVTKIDKNTGKILFKKGVSEILLENNYKNFVYGFSNPPHNLNDNLHLNDIEPVMEDSRYWKKGDLFLSMRHRSLVLLYRPSTNKILRLIYGPFINQHDIDVISDKEISIFNNNYIVDGEIQTGKKFEQDKEDRTDIDSLVSSEIIIYNFEDSTFRLHLNKFLNEEKVMTYSQGFSQILKNGDVYVEAQNFGKLYILNENGFVLKKEIKTSGSEYVHMPNWIRIFEELNL